MKTTTRLTISCDEFSVFESIRESGLTNMFNINAVVGLSGCILNRAKCIEIMKDYANLKERYSDKR